MALNVGRGSVGLLRRLPCVFEGQPVLLVCGGTGRLPVATLRATYGEKYPYPKPFPYERKKYNWLSTFLDKTMDRFNENTKVVVVEGNIGVGKTEFAKRLAKEFDMKFFPPTSEKSCFLHKEYNYDLRGLDPLLPPTARTYDLKKFYMDPHPERGIVGRLQLQWYEEKFYDYLLALKHLLSTGQGVVLVRSVYSDSVFVDALRAMGWVSANFVRHYNMIRSNSICDLYHPHLTIYLDAPLNVIRQRLSKDNPDVANYRNLSDEFLKTIDRVYQQRFLPKMRETGEVVEIDWSEIANQADMDVIAEELQLVKLDAEDNEDVKFSDWSRQDEDDWIKFRLFLEDDQAQVGYFVRPVPWDCPEVMLSLDDRLAMTQLVQNHPIFKHAAGWSPELGHSTLLKF
jgi:NADH dehydrogenase (ubiquinone) 1 alpha subcomplex subunit 10